MLLTQGVNTAAAQEAPGYEVILKTDKSDYIMGVDSATVSGEVYYRGRPLPGAALALELDDAGGPLNVDKIYCSDVGMFAWTIPSGTFQSEGQYKVYVKVNGSAYLSSIGFQVKANIPSSVAGYIYRQDGSPFTGVNLTILQNGQPKFETVTNAQGAFTIQNVSPGTYQLAVFFPGYKKAYLNLGINAGDQFTVAPRMLLATNKCDLDGSGNIDDEDLKFLFKYYRMTDSKTGWISAVDVFPDGQINVKDLVTIGKTFGERF